MHSKYIIITHFCFLEQQNLHINLPKRLQLLCPPELLTGVSLLGPTGGPDPLAPVVQILNKQLGVLSAYVGYTEMCHHYSKQVVC